MPVTADELIFTGCDQHAEDDVSQQGGAESMGKRISFDGGEMASSGTVYLEADVAITGTWRVTGRSAGGIVTEDFVFSAEAGPKNGSQSFDYLTKVELVTGNLAAAATLGVYETTPDSILCYLYGNGVDPLGVEVTEVRRFFLNSIIPGGGSTDRYEKMFVRNVDPSDAVSLGEGRETADAGGEFEFAIATALGDTESTTDRLTAPVAVGTFDSLDKSLPTNLVAGSAIALWAKYTLSAGASAGARHYNQQVRGNAFA